MKLIRRLHFPVLLSSLWLTAVGSYVHDYYRDRLIDGSSGFDLILPCVALFCIRVAGRPQGCGNNFTT
jgi:hypothetical protein